MMKAKFYDKEGNLIRETNLNYFVTIDLFLVKDWCSKIIFEGD